MIQLCYQCQFVHRHLQASGEKITQMTPAAIYDIFIDLCRARLHLLISCTTGENFVSSKIFRKHKSLLCGAVQINFRVSKNRNEILDLFYRNHILKMWICINKNLTFLLHLRNGQKMHLRNQQILYLRKSMQHVRSRKQCQKLAWTSLRSRCKPQSF